MMLPVRVIALRFVKPEYDQPDLRLSTEHQLSPSFGDFRDLLRQPPWFTPHSVDRCKILHDVLVALLNGVAVLGQVLPVGRDLFTNRHILAARSSPLLKCFASQ